MSRDDRPIKFNPKGKYNVNFIDWNNEWERVSEVERKIENGEIVSDEEEYNRVVNYLEKERLKNGVKLLPNETILSKHDVNKLASSKKPSECYICFNQFKVSTVVMKLPCSHIFCSKCLIPWLKENSTCPTCKFNLKKCDKYNEDDEYIDI